ncbi:MAG: YkgJ family cysteine cluster protein [Bryobacter sp.]|jgi:hypothetical protein|nr:YkgJ family cysteine cluster protein [Bryobacter sp.]
MAGAEPHGVRFTCQPECSKCCEVEGYVYFTDEDIRKAARHLGMSARAFEKQYIYRTKHLRRMRKPRGKQCHFLEGHLCGLHPDKPAQCRLFPFWPELVESRREWTRTGKWCPGIGKGELIQITEAVEIADGMRRAYPAMYE